MDLGIANKVALVTASSKGLGRATAEALAAEGVSVVISARTEEVLNATAKAIEAQGGSVHAIAADVTQPDVPQQLVDATIAHFGSIDILVANAGGPPPMRALEVDDEAIESAVNNNLQTSIRLVKAAVPHMEPRHWGRIALITGSAVKQPMPNLPLSGLARTGLWSWAKTAAHDLFAAGVTLNTVCPGLHATDRVKELGIIREGTPTGDPADFGKVVAFLCSEPAKFISGTAVSVDGATTLGLL